MPATARPMEMHLTVLVRDVLNLLVTRYLDPYETINTVNSL
jgi:hypothetical protein